MDVFLGEVFSPLNKIADDSVNSILSFHSQHRILDYKVQERTFETEKKKKKRKKKRHREKRKREKGMSALTQGNNDLEGKKGKVGGVDAVEVLGDDLEAPLLDILHVVLKCLLEDCKAGVPRYPSVKEREGLRLELVDDEAVRKGEEGQGVGVIQLDAALVEVLKKDGEHLATVLILELDHPLVLLLEVRVEEAAEVL